MGMPVLVIGRSGTGKSTSLRNFNIDEVGVFEVANKRLPFQKKLNVLQNAGYEQIVKSLSNPKLKTYVIDDSQYLMGFAMLNRAKEKGFDKFTEIAQNFWHLLQFILTKVPDDVIVYFLHHSEYLDSGEIKAKTCGKMIDNILTMEGLFTIVLFSEIVDKKYCFITQSDGNTTAKTPMEMFQDEMIDNDLKAVDRRIREYYDIGGEGSAGNN